MRSMPRPDHPLTPKPPDALASVEQATLAQLQERFPAEWAAIGRDLVVAVETARPEALVAFVKKAQARAQPWRARLAKARGNPPALGAALPQVAKARMARLAVEQTLQAVAARAATGQVRGTVRFGLLGGWLVQRLLFAYGLVRKPVSMTAFRLLWWLVPRRRILMQLVQPRGIYCFYSGALIRALADLIGTRRCLEIAAGDGTLARFLAAAGVTIRATDDHSWQHAVTYPEGVERVDARQALSDGRCAAVICSFPPPQNAFERGVFQTTSVQLYVVITTRHRFAAGNWDSYRDQTGFTCTEDRRLARLVLPPELDPTVLVFRRD